MLIRPLQIIDSFYSQPEKIRQRAIDMHYEQPDALIGWRTRCYQPPGIKKLIETKLGIRISYWEDDVDATEACNGVFFTALSSGSKAERVGIHYDDPPSWMMLLIYLTPNAPFDAGTSLWQHRETGLTAKPTRRDAVRLGVTVSELESRLIADSKTPCKWIEIDRIGNRFNRAVIFPSGVLHSATRHFGRSLHHGRLYQTFHFPVFPNHT